MSDDDELATSDAWQSGGVSHGDSCSVCGAWSSRGISTKHMLLHAIEQQNEINRELRETLRGLLTQLALAARHTGETET